MHEQRVCEDEGDQRIEFEQDAVLGIEMDGDDEIARHGCTQRQPAHRAPTEGRQPHHALALISGIYLGGVYGGSRSAILLNIPGAPSAIATGMDGYPLAKRGEAGQAIGLTTVVSVYGGFIGILALAVAAPLVSDLALMFGPRDYMLLAVWGLLLVGSLSGESLSKGIFAGALGALISCVGLDPMTGEQRLTFGSLQMSAGISYIAAMIGFFGVAEVIAQLHELNIKAIKQNVSKIIPSWALVRKHLPLATRTSAIGVVVGALPGLGPASAMALLLPFTVHVSPLGALVLMAAIYYGAQYSGAATAIWTNVPGESSAAMTCNDGHPMALTGRGRQAQWLALELPVQVRSPSSFV